MLQMTTGSHVPNAASLHEGYELDGNYIQANVNADKIQGILEAFMDRNADRPLFLFIEVPANMNDETVTGMTEDGYAVTESKHKDIYYLDGRSAAWFKALLEPFWQLLIHDGLCQFGIGNNIGEEVGKYKYNIMQLWTRDESAGKYAGLFENAGIPRIQKLVTAWDTFSQDAPGECELLTAENGKNIYDLVELLKEAGLYHAGQREE